MASTYSQYDLDLCRKILLRTEEVMASNRPKGPSNYEFEGYSPETVEHNIRKLNDNDLISVKVGSEQRRGTLNYWPRLLYDKGFEFIEVARDEEVWKEALEQIEERGVNPTLKRVKKILLENASEVI